MSHASTPGAPAPHRVNGPESHGAAHAASTAPATLSARLREATAEQHTRAEKHGVQQALVRGKAEPRLYAAWLCAMRGLHEPFEARLDAARRLPGFAAVIEDHHFRVSNIDEDLDALAVIMRQSGAEANATGRSGLPGPRSQAAWAAIDAMIEIDPALVIGPFYVLEGSTNGGRFIAQAIRRALPLPPNAGTRYLDPHGDLIRERWARTKAAIDALPLTPSQHDGIVAAAQKTFDMVTTLMDELDGAPAAG
ncbi:MAG: biliverdin-producing heme oxygenase [Phycisphaeraceae bacterium]|nr:biliverdin-producing heme oxygenase [Phycisphaeraceae bacterium]